MGEQFVEVPPIEQLSGQINERRLLQPLDIGSSSNQGRRDFAQDLALRSKMQSENQRQKHEADQYLRQKPAFALPVVGDSRHEHRAGFYQHENQQKKAQSSNLMVTVDYFRHRWSQGVDSVWRFV